MTAVLLTAMTTAACATQLYYVERGTTVSDGERFRFRSAFRGKSDEQVAFDAINAFRAQHGLPAVTWSEELGDASRNWSITMRRTGRFAHGAGGANIARNHLTGEASAMRAVEQWRNSSGHRAFLLSRNITEAGVGGDGGYWTFRARSRSVERSAGWVQTQPVLMQTAQPVVELSTKTSFAPRKLCLKKRHWCR